MTDDTPTHATPNSGHHNLCGLHAHINVCRVQIGGDAMSTATAIFVLVFILGFIAVMIWMGVAP
jgi:hypothetical protein